MSGEGAGSAIPPELCELLVTDDVYGRLVVDANGIVLHANAAAGVLCGRPVEELIGAFMLDHVAPEDLAVGEEGVEELQSHGSDEAEGIPMVFGIIQPDQSVVHVEVGSNNYFDVDGLNVAILRLRPYESQFHLQEFLRSMVERGAVGPDLDHLVASLDSTIQESASAVCSGWTGHGFAEVVTRQLSPILSAAAEAEPVSAAGGPWVDALATGELTWVGVDDLPEPLRTHARAEGYRACWAKPVDVVGAAPGTDSAIVVWRRLAGSPRLGHRAALDRLAGAATLAFERAHQQRALLRAATIDALTGLPNRAQFFAALGDDPESISAVLYLDLDGFKPVNDAHGHRFGDMVLQSVARVLEAAVKPSELLARLGGDEFAILCRDRPTVEELGHLAGRLIQAVSQQFELGGVTIQLGLSVGVAHCDSGHTGEALLDAADRMLYEVKRSGRGNWASMPAI